MVFAAIDIFKLAQTDKKDGEQRKLLCLSDPLRRRDFSPPSSDEWEEREEGSVEAAWEGHWLFYNRSSQKQIFFYGSACHPTENALESILSFNSGQSEDLPAERIPMPDS